MKKLMSMVMFLASLQAFADGGGGVGNGGNVVLCKSADSENASVEVLDYYEARTLYGKTLKFSTVEGWQPSARPQERASEIIGRMKGLLPDLTAELQDRVTQWDREVSYVDHVDLVNVDDSHHLLLPTGCKIVQLVIQRDPYYPEAKHFLVNNDVWKLMNDDQRAGIIVHEILYEHALKVGAKDSVGVRYLNGLISSEEFLAMDAVEFYRRVILAGILEKKCNGDDCHERVFVDGIPLKLAVWQTEAWTGRKWVSSIAVTPNRTIYSGTAWGDGVGSADFTNWGYYNLSLLPIHVSSFEEVIFKRSSDVKLSGSELRVPYYVLDLDKMLFYGRDRGRFIMPWQSGFWHEASLCSYFRTNEKGKYNLNDGRVVKFRCAENSPTHPLLLNWSHHRWSYGRLQQWDGRCFVDKIVLNNDGTKFKPSGQCSHENEEIYEPFEFRSKSMKKLDHFFHDDQLYFGRFAVGMTALTAGLPFELLSLGDHYSANISIDQRIEWKKVFEKIATPLPKK